MKVVSANYLDRKAAQRWMMRDRDQSPSEAKTFSTIVATGVTFEPSNKREMGFGCATVAYCKTAIGSNRPTIAGKDEIKLSFDGTYFVDPDKKRISKCAALRLEADGGMYAVLNAPARTADDRAREVA